MSLRVNFAMNCIYNMFAYNKLETNQYGKYGNSDLVMNQPCISVQSNYRT